MVLVRGKRGRALQAIRENEIAAVSSGISLTRYKTFAFGVSAFYAGVAGSLYVILNFIVTPGSFPITLSILLLVGLVVGGATSLLGVLVGAIFVEFIPLYSGDVARPVVNLAPGGRVSDRRHRPDDARRPVGRLRPPPAARPVS